MTAHVLTGGDAALIIETFRLTDAKMAEAFNIDPSAHARTAVIELGTPNTEGVNDYLVVDNERGVFAVHYLTGSTRQEVRQYYNKVAEKPGWEVRPAICDL